MPTDLSLSLIQHILQKLQTSNLNILSIIPEDPWLKPCDDTTVKFKPYRLDDQHIQDLIEQLTPKVNDDLSQNANELLADLGFIFQVEFEDPEATKKITDLILRNRIQLDPGSTVSYTTTITIYHDSIVYCSREYFKRPSNINKGTTYTHLDQEQEQTLEWTDPDLLDKIEQILNQNNHRRNKNTPE